MAVLKTLGITALAAAVLGVGGYVGDGYARDATEQQVARSLQTSLNLDEPPEVTLGGVPFSLAFVTRTVPDGRAGSPSVPVEVAGKIVTLDNVTATAQRIRLEDTRVVLGAAQGEAGLDYADLSTLAGVPVDYGEDGRLRVRYTAALFGQQVTAEVSAVPQLDEPAQQIRLVDAELTVAGLALDAAVVQQLLDRIVQPIDVALPYDIRVASLEARPEGLHVGVEGEDVAIPLV